MQCTNPTEKIKFIPYYRSSTITSLITKNNQGPPTPTLKKTNVIYQYQCPHGDCEHHPSTYIGLTTTTLSRRLTMHLASGGPKQHALENHNLTLTRNDLVSNTKIIYNQSNHNKLSIMEALLIKKLQPSINNQCTGINRTLKLFTWADSDTAPQSPETSHSTYFQSQYLPLPPPHLCTIAVPINLYSYPVTKSCCHNCISQNLHLPSSYANCPLYTLVVPPKNVNQTFTSGLYSTWSSFTRYLSRDNTHLSPPDDDLP